MARTENTFHLLSLRILKCILLLTISSFTCAKKLGYIKIRITRFEKIFQNFLIIFFSREFPLFQREEGKIQREEEAIFCPWKRCFDQTIIEISFHPQISRTNNVENFLQWARTARVYNLPRKIGTTFDRLLSPVDTAERKNSTDRKQARLVQQIRFNILIVVKNDSWTREEGRERFEEIPRRWYHGVEFIISRFETRTPIEICVLIIKSDSLKIIYIIWEKTDQILRNILPSTTKFL